MLSFHNDKSIKEKYLKRVINHREMDNIIQGTGWENGKGCAVGCTLENYDHSRYPIELGIPEWLAKLEDVIFENLSNEEAMRWPELFLESIPVGVDLEPIKHKLAIKRMDNLLHIQNNLLSKNPDLSQIFIDTINAIELIKKCHESELNKTYCDWSAAESAAWSAAWSAAESASRSAARSAWSAARSAAWSAAWSAACSAAESASRSAARSARSAAWSAAWSASRSAARSASRSAAWSAAESAAWSAAESAAESAAWSAAESASRSAARSAWSAAWSAARSAAWSASRSASRSAWSAAWSAALKKESNDLIELFKECK